MNVRLLRYNGSTISAIKCLRDAASIASLVTAKNFVEHLPVCLDVHPNRVDDLRREFDLEIEGVDSNSEWLLAKWDRLMLDQKVQLLQYLENQHLLGGSLK